MQDQKRRRGGEPRVRLVGGLLAALPEKGYAKLTIADIVRHAGVSKRTFYEHFAGKEDCFLTAYERLSDRGLEAVAAAPDASAPWEEQVSEAVRTYVDFLVASPELARIFMAEIYAAGPRAMALQRQTHARFGKMLQRLVARGRRHNPELEALSGPMATAVVGGIHELVLVALHEGKPLRSVTPTITKLVGAVLS
jgi:AcrR family transcriptional regulator